MRKSDRSKRKNQIGRLSGLGDCVKTQMGRLGGSAARRLGGSAARRLGSSILITETARSKPRNKTTPITIPPGA